MKVYFAGGDSYLNEKYDIIGLGVNKILTSFFGVRDATMMKFHTCRATGNPIDLFLDCGAYSAWTQGKPINIHDYAKFVIKHQDIINVYPNLDVKGDLEATVANQKILEDQYGLHPIPVFHVNTLRWDILEKYIEEYDYIALGAIAGEKLGDEYLIKALDNVFCRAKRKPTTKFHGFGFTMRKFLERYPFYSVDSTSWLAPISWGQNMGGGQVGEMHIKKRDNKKAIVIGINKYLELEKYITDLWTARGITWED